jgi:hypothetical protein
MSRRSYLLHSQPSHWQSVQVSPEQPHSVHWQSSPQQPQPAALEVVAPANADRAKPVVAMRAAADFRNVEHNIRNLLGS